ncbi:MAG: HAMP domain-containing sensor histidine kinase [Sulfuricurvum sp.]|nr:HAMP domain-containing sensor histidine kinase [Sulfuricurvum sp.]
MPKRSIKALFFTLTAISLILMAIGSIWLYSYATTTISQQLAHTAHEKSDTIRYEIIRFYDGMVYTFTQTQPLQIAKMAQAQSYFQKHGMNASLQPLQKILEDSDSQYDIYLINKNMIVERTTFEHDLGLDFKQYTFVPKLLLSLFNHPTKTDISEPLYISFSDDFKRYTTQASANRHYIIQLRQTLKESKSFRTFMNHLKELVPTLYSHSIYTVYKTNRQSIDSQLFWSQRLSKIKNKDVIQLWGSLGNFQQILQRIDPTSVSLFKYPQLFLYPYLDIMFKHNTRKELTYWKDSRYLRMVMLPQQSYYNQLEESYSFLVVELDETEIYNNAQTMKMTMLISWTLLIGFVLTMSTLFYRRVIVPITLLQSHMHSKTPLKDIKILTKDDEISKISRTYNWLLNDLKNQIETKQTLLAQFKTFTANAIHQVRTPLSVIKIAHSMIDDDAHKEAKLHILSSLISMEHMYDSLAFTLQNDKVELPKSILDISLIIEKSITLFSPVASAVDSKIVSNIRSGLFVEMNQSELEYLIDNNLSNALKYGQPFQSIGVTLTQSNHELILLFQSYGDPIADKNAIFERYTRQDHSKQGSGIGLNIVATICERYNIIIHVTYEDGKNCFCYFFPIK